MIHMVNIINSTSQLRMHYDYETFTSLIKFQIMISIRLMILKCVIEHVFISVYSRQSFWNIQSINRLFIFKVD